MRQQRIKRKNTSHGIILLKLISMFLMITVTMLDSSNLLLVTTPAVYYFFMLIKTMADCSFNCCIIAAGYEQYKQPWNLLKIIGIWTIIGFYAKTIATILGIIMPTQVGFIDWLKAMFPIITNHYWFIVNYLALLLLQPLLNAALESVSKRTIQIVLIASLICISCTTILSTDTFGINNGQSLLWMVLMYCLGGYIRKYRAWSKLDGAGVLVVASILIVGLWTIGIFWDLASPSNHFGEWTFIQPTAPTGILISIVLFIAFKQIRVNKKMQMPLKVMRKLSIGPYLLCANPLILGYVVPELAKNSFSSYIVKAMCFMGMVLLCYVIGLIIEAVRESIFQRFNILRNTFKTMTKIKNKIENIQTTTIEKKSNDDWDTIGIKIGKTVEAMCNDIQIYKEFGLDNTQSSHLQLRPMVYKINTIHTRKGFALEQNKATMQFQKAQ